MRDRLRTTSTAALAWALAASTLAAQDGFVVTSNPLTVIALDPNAPQAPAPALSTSGQTTVLQLANGGSIVGELADSANPASIRWRSPAFSSPIDFASTGVNAVRWAPPAKLPEPLGDYRFELASGGVVFGSLIALDDSTVEIDSPKLGRLHIDRSSLHRFHRRSENADVIYSGPNGLVGWNPSIPKDSWREESGQPLSTVDGATMRGNLGLPARAVVEFELSWKGKPDFVLALGVEDDPGIKRSFRFEIWDETLVVTKENESTADIASLGPIADKRNRVHLVAYLDQEKGRIQVVGPDGKPMADLTVPDAKPRSFPGVGLVNIKGDVRLESLRIAKWDGSPPRLVEADRSRVHNVDGTIAYGQVARFDAASKEFVFKGDAGETRVAENKIADVFLTNPADMPARAIRALYSDGTQLAGDLKKIDRGVIELGVAGIREAVRMPVEGLRSLATAKAEAAPVPKVGRSGTLEVEGVRLLGHLVDAKEGPGVSGLAWQPDGGSPSPLLPAASGRIVYVDPKPPAAVAAQQPPQARRGFVALNNMLDQLSTTAAKREADSRRALHLRTGDVIPCEITGIDETGVRFKSPLSPGTFVPHSKIKAIELAPLRPDFIKLSKAKRERMLTLPRMQKDSPPTQLIRSTNGDFLRGRVLAMDTKTLDLEVRLESKSILRDRIARIVWFHADEMEPAKPPEPGGPVIAPNASMRVQVVRSDGVRLTYHPETFAEGTLNGTSEVLGACKVRLEDIDQLLLGGSIEKTAAQLTYGRWIMHNAEEPKFLTASGPGAGVESPLVGKPAPDFELEMLDGKKFHLADNKGQVVVLDFWATWCGPCVQAMPQVERVTKEFKDQGVKLIAVNLMEGSADIKAMLERHKLDVTVALDRDGVVADKYAATAIPQTVVIGRDGSVKNLFVGGGPDYEAQIRDSLSKAVEPSKAEPPK